jgi:hypothetical protein
MGSSSPCIATKRTETECHHPKDPEGRRVQAEEAHSDDQAVLEEDAPVEEDAPQAEEAHLPNAPLRQQKTIPVEKRQVLKSRV